MNKKDLARILRHPLFAGTDEALLLQILSDDTPRTAAFDAGEVLFSPASSRRLAGILLEGKAEILTPDESHPTLLRQLNAGELFGITNLFSGEECISVIRAKSTVRICLLRDRDLRTLMDRDPAFLDRYLKFLAGRIRFLNRKIGYLTAGSAERRLALYLASYPQDRIILEASISALSELLDIGRASLYRAFDHLSADGFLQKTGRQILLTDRDAMLRAYQ